jgi:hypothetical protein
MVKKKIQKALHPSRAYFVFEKTIERSLNLIELGQPVITIIKAKATNANVDASDLLRASLVLGVAAMDSYFTSIFAERFIRYIKRMGINNKIVEILKKANFTIEVAVELLAMERPYRGLRTRIDEYLSKYTTQNIEVIDDLFLAFCIKDFSKHISRLKRRKRLMSSINSVVKRRHQIVHEGDLNGHGTMNKIDEKDVRRKLQDIILFVAGADEILQKQL